MNSDEELELLWDSHDFLLKQIDILEREFTFLLEQAQNYFTQDIGDCLFEIANDPQFSEVMPSNLVEAIKELEEEGSSGVPVDDKVLIKQFTQVSSDLETYYTKQLNTVKEIKIFYRDKKFAISPDREVGFGTLSELEEVTVELRSAHRNSTEEILELISIHESNKGENE